MGWLSETTFGKDYGDVLETCITYEGEMLYVGVHSEGRGADVLTLEELPEVSDIGHWDGFASQSNQSAQQTLQNIAGDMMHFSTEMGGQSAAVTELMNSGQINIFDNAGVDDVARYDEALELISKEAAILSNSSQDPEFSAVMGDIANDALGAREALNETLESTGFSAVNAVNRELAEMGVPVAEIKAAMTMPENVNSAQTDASPMPGMEQLP
jgi:hypothetical protein